MKYTVRIEEVLVNEIEAATSYEVRFSEVEYSLK